MVSTRPEGVPVCLTPVKQCSPGGPATDSEPETLADVDDIVGVQTRTG
jgi:hypothetical protein